jgi:Short C-terminal domain
VVEGVGLDVSDGGQVKSPRREFVALVWLLVIMGALIGLVSVIAIWLDRVALETDSYVDTTGRLLDDPAIRDALSIYLVDELYRRVDVSGEIQQQLPEQMKSLAPILAGGGREPAVLAAERAFESHRAQSLWRNANRDVHRQFLQLIDDRAQFVSNSGGVVTLQVRPILVELANRVGLGQRVDERLHADAGNVVLMQSNELDYAQSAVRVLRFLADWLWIFAFVSWGAAIYLARSWRREALGMITVSFVVLGVVIVVARGIAGGVVVDELVRVESNRAAAESAWSIVTSGLRDSGVSLAIIGMIGTTSVWLAGPGEVPVSARRALAPYIRRPGVAFGSLALALLVLIWWAPIAGVRSPLWLLVFGGLAFMGMALLRRQTMREHPVAETPDMAGSLRGWVGSLGSNLKSAPARSEASLEAEWVERLERLQALRERGALTEEEFQAQKTALMQPQ